MKKLGLTSVLAPAAVTVALAVSMVGCSTGSAETGTSASASASSVETSTADTQTTSSAASIDADQAAINVGAGGQGGTSSAAATQETTGQNADNTSTTNNAGGKMGGMNNAAMDLQPGQTNDKGYTANDSGTAITATLNTADAFTERDLEQTADTSSAQNLTVADGQDITITEEGVYVISGQASEATIIVEAADTAKVQLVLDNVSITNTDSPAIYVKSADKVFVTLSGDNALSVTGTFTADGDTNTDGVVFSKDDLCLNGSGSLTITSPNHGIVSKDDLKVTGGTYTITAEAGSALSANDSVRIAGGTFTISAADGIKAKNDDDNELGYIYISDGTFDITTTDNGIQGYAFVWIDGGTLNLKGTECIEGTYVQINGGTVNVEASDDGINASIKSSVYTPTIDITGGEVNITMGSGDTDALDSNGYIYISGGKVDITGQSAFDYAWGAELTGGEVYVNGTQVNEITDSMMGGGMMGGGMMQQDGQTPGNMGGQTPPDGGMGGGRPEGMGGGRPEGMGGGRPGQNSGQSATGSSQTSTSEQAAETDTGTAA